MINFQRFVRDILYLFSLIRADLVWCDSLWLKRNFLNSKMKFFFIYLGYFLIYASYVNENKRNIEKKVTLESFFDQPPLMMVFKYQRN